MMDILMYLFETYIHSDAEFTVDQDELEDELLLAGFRKPEIYQALQWLEGLAKLQQDRTLEVTTNAVSSFRIYTQDEMLRLDTECRGFILLLEQVQVLTTETREMIIDRVMELNTREFDLKDLKWVILMVLFNVPGNESAYTQMEELLYTAEYDMAH